MGASSLYQIFSKTSVSQFSFKTLATYQNIFFFKNHALWTLKTAMITAYVFSYIYDNRPTPVATAHTKPKVPFLLWNHACYINHFWGTFSETFLCFFFNWSFTSTGNGHHQFKGCKLLINGFSLQKMSCSNNKIWLMPDQSLIIFSITHLQIWKPKHKLSVPLNMPSNGVRFWNY